MTRRKIDRSYGKFESSVLNGKDLKPQNGDRGYAKDYDSIIAWFKRRKQWESKDVRIGCLIVYGWMPTILRTNRMEDFHDFAERLNVASLTEDDYKFVNNSYIGTSKFLHFWNPQQFAIWDRRICTTLDWGVLANTKVNFMKYQGYCRDFQLQHKWRLRDIEQSLFLQKEPKD